MVLREEKLEPESLLLNSEYFKTELDENNEIRNVCVKCGRSYKHMFHLRAHGRECSKEPMFEVSFIQMLSMNALCYRRPD